MIAPLTLDEHRELARKMKETELCLRTICDLVVGVYGPQNRASFSFRKAIEAIERLNQDLQTQATHDLPGYPAKDLYL